ncbi:hypothetical protein Ade02nite_08780 [Paractinoplanes deccanensis]|uniref:Calcineurin-like phosphoesterase domain-containing protein n=1 Tax=Paractinoplanes deccanensis TaxID=113561 RepID=A0ABQ3XWW9_9ACTN|nr:metallophosphoesterase [Actinoplanes deccanensis]GID72237.1 hypothetical protein Ade02nite_08780 [Actinoplanes deccanensis]
MDPLPPPVPGTAVRVLATTDLGFALVPMTTSHGLGGTPAGVAALLDRERRRRPTVWLDAGDLTVGPVEALLGRRPWDEVTGLPIDAAAAGNHDFDDGLPASPPGFPLLCANADAGLAPCALIDTGAGGLGVIGLTNPWIHEFTGAPRPYDDGTERVTAHARGLRAAGARWVVAVVHDGVAWWPADGDRPVHTRADRLAALVRPWLAQVDLVLGGHTPAGWAGAVDGVPVAHPFAFASTVLVADLLDDPASAVVRGSYPVPPERPAARTEAVEALDEAAARVVARLDHTWLTRTGARHYLPDLVATALRRATGADAALVPPGKHGTQAPLDGAVGALCAGDVTALDVTRVFGTRAAPLVVRLRGDEFRRLLDFHDRCADPRNAGADDLWWNWCRMPAGRDSTRESPATVAVMPSVLPQLTAWLGRDLDTEPGDTPAVDALARLLSR